MPSEKVNFRAVPPLDDALESRRLPGHTLGRVTSEIIDRWSLLMERELRSVRLTEGDFEAIGAALRTTTIDGFFTRRDAQQALAQEIEDLTGDAGQPAYPDTLAKVNEMSPGQAAAILDGWQRFLVALHPEEGKDEPATPLQVARQVGFRIVSEGPGAPVAGHHPHEAIRDETVPRSKSRLGPRTRS